MEDARTVLADLLDRLDGAQVDPALHLQAATMANRLALFHSDPSLADVAESMVLELPTDAPQEIRIRLEEEQAVARATRRAIALGHRQALHSPRDKSMALVGDPQTLAHRIREQRRQGADDLASATLEVARLRHPDDAGLSRLDDSPPATS